MSTKRKTRSFSLLASQFFFFLNESGPLQQNVPEHNSHYILTKLTNTMKNTDSARIDEPCVVNMLHWYKSQRLNCTQGWMHWEICCSVCMIITNSVSWSLLVFFPPFFPPSTHVYTYTRMCLRGWKRGSPMGEPVMASFTDDILLQRQTDKKLASLCASQPGSYANWLQRSLAGYTEPACLLIGPQSRNKDQRHRY